MREGPITSQGGYVRRRRRIGSGFGKRLRLLAFGRWGKLALALLVLAGIVAAVARLAAVADAPDPAQAMRDGRAALTRGNYSAARNHLIAAVSAEPANGPAQVALARTYLLLGDGAAAAGALDRAAAAGVPADRLRAPRAEALLLAGDQDAARAALGQTAGAEADRLRARALAADGDPAGATDILRRLLAANPRDAAAWTDLGRIRFEAEDIGAAAQAAVRATALDRSNLAALVLRAEVVRSRYGLVASLPWFEEALRRDAYYHPALIEYAGTLGDAGRHADSVAAAERALAARPGSPQALYLLAVVAARAGNLDLAAGLLDRTGGALDGLPGGLLLSGGIDYAAGRYEQAVVKWRALVATQPMNLVARRLLGAALLRSGDAAGALEVLRPVALRRDADSYSLALVARAFEARGDRVMAARFLDRAAAPAATASVPFGQDENVAVLAEEAAQSPGDPAAAVSYLRGLLERGQGPQALSRAQAIAAASPGAPLAHLLVGDVLAAQRRFSEAAEAYERAADLRFDQPTMLRLVEARVAAADRRGAADVLALYLAQNPASVAARRSLANLQLVSGDANAAIGTLESLRGDLGGRDALLLAQLAQAYAAAGDPAAAVPPARAGYRLQPMNAALADAWGYALFHTGDTPRALQLLTKAAALAPGVATVRWHQAQALADAGQVAQARAALAVALADRAFADREAATRLLQSLPPG